MSTENTANPFLLLTEFIYLGCVSWAVIGWCTLCWSVQVWSCKLINAAYNERDSMSLIIGVVNSVCYMSWTHTELTPCKVNFLLFTQLRAGGLLFPVLGVIFIVGFVISSWAAISLTQFLMFTAVALSLAWWPRLFLICMLKVHSRPRAVPLFISKAAPSAASRVCLVQPLFVFLSLNCLFLSLCFCDQSLKRWMFWVKSLLD